jgi:hypothetical protein
VTEVSSGIDEMPAMHLARGCRVALWPNLLSVKSAWAQLSNWPARKSSLMLRMTPLTGRP